MPSPFPGMDPYLEGDLWTTVHSMFAATIVLQLAPQIRPRYVALPAKSLVVALSGEGKTNEPAIPHVNVEVRETQRRQLVASIEILSPTIRQVRFLEKRDELLKSDVHFLAIDLLRNGRWNTARRRSPAALYHVRPVTPYRVLLSRASDRSLLCSWPIDFRDPLPTVPIPLLKDDADARLDLQKALTDIYDDVGYADIIDYSQPPDPALPPDVEKWADQLLRAAKLRK
jgi:Protein of unknown function (DUF4058)